MIKAILFDMDGVLIDSRKAWFVIFNNALKKFENKQINQDEFNSEVWAVSLPTIVDKYFSRSPEQIRDFINSQNQEFNDNLDQFKDTKDTLVKLKEQGLLITVATNSPKIFTESTLKSLDLYDLFDFVLTNDDVIRSKPDPEMIQKTLDYLQVPKENAVLVGDTRWDEGAAINAKIDFIGFNYNSEQNIKTLSELFDLI